MVAPCTPLLDSLARLVVLPYEVAVRLEDGVDEEEDLVEVSCRRLAFRPSMLQDYLEYRRINLFIS